MLELIRKLMIQAELILLQVEK